MVKNNLSNKNSLMNGEDVASGVGVVVMKSISNTSNLFIGVTNG